MSVAISNGWIIKPSDDKKIYAYELRQLDKSHFQQMLDLQQVMQDNPADRELCVARPVAVFEEVLAGQGIAVGVFVEKKCIAYRMLYFPGDTQYNIGQFINLPSSELPAVANLEFELVHPAFRGNGLQKFMGRSLLKIAREIPMWRHLCSVVAPQNFPSVIDKFFHGLVVVKLMLVLGTYWRYIFHQERGISFAAAPESIVAVASADWEKQISLLEQGYRGFSLQKGTQGMEILMGLQGE